MLPAIASQMVVALKDSALGYLIGYVEIVRSGQQLGAFFGNYLPALIVVALIMIVLNSTLTQFATWLRAAVASSVAVRAPGWRSRRFPSRSTPRPAWTSPAARTRAPGSVEPDLDVRVPTESVEQVLDVGTSLGEHVLHHVERKSLQVAAASELTTMRRARRSRTARSPLAISSGSTLRSLRRTTSAAFSRSSSRVRSASAAVARRP